MPKPCTNLTPEDAERVQQNALTRREYLAQEQRLLREITKSEDAIARLESIQARAALDLSRGGVSSAEHDLDRCLYAHNARALDRLRATLLAEREELARLRAVRPKAIYPKAADPKVRSHQESARRYREKNREKLAAQARERRARDRLVLAVAKGELDIFS